MAPAAYEGEVASTPATPQVLSGTAPGGRELVIGFEDLPSGTGDNDFQDVVIGVRTNHDGIFFA